MASYNAGTLTLTVEVDSSGAKSELNKLEKEAKQTGKNGSDALEDLQDKVEDIETSQAVHEVRRLAEEVEKISAMEMLETGMEIGGKVKETLQAAWDFSKEQMEQFQENHITALELGISLPELNELTIFAGQLNVPVGSITSAFSALNDTINGTDDEAKEALESLTGLSSVEFNLLSPTEQLATLMDALSQCSTEEEAAAMAALILGDGFEWVGTLAFNAGGKIEEAAGKAADFKLSDKQVESIAAAAEKTSSLASAFSNLASVSWATIVNGLDAFLTKVAGGVDADGDTRFDNLTEDIVNLTAAISGEIPLGYTDGYSAMMYDLYHPDGAMPTYNPDTGIWTDRYGRKLEKEWISAYEKRLDEEYLNPSWQWYWDITQPELVDQAKIMKEYLNQQRNKPFTQPLGPQPAEDFELELPDTTQVQTKIDEITPEGGYKVETQPAWEWGEGTGNAIPLDAMGTFIANRITAAPGTILTLSPSSIVIRG